MSPPPCLSCCAYRLWPCPPTLATTLTCSRVRRCPQGGHVSIPSPPRSLVPTLLFYTPLLACPLCSLSPRSSPLLTPPLPLLSSPPPCTAQDMSSSREGSLSGGSMPMPRVLRRLEGKAGSAMPIVGPSNLSHVRACSEGGHAAWGACRKGGHTVRGACRHDRIRLQPAYAAIRRKRTRSLALTAHVPMRTLPTNDERLTT